MDAVYAHLVGFGVFVAVLLCCWVTLWAAWSLALQAYDDWREGPRR